MPDDTDHLGTWLTASAAEWHSEPALQGFLQLLADNEEPRHYIKLFRKLLDLSIDELEAIVDAVTSHHEQIDLENGSHSF